MAKIIRNIDTEAHTYRGKYIEVGESYSIQYTENLSMSNCDELISDIANGKAQMNNGMQDVVGIANQLNFLSGEAKEFIQEGINSSGGMRARLVGIGKITATANTTTNLDWLIPQLTYNSVNKICYFDGIEFYAKDASIGDILKFQVVDINNILGYGYNVILEEFGQNWYAIPNSLREIKLYKARLIVGLYLRIVYTNIHTTQDVDLVCNIFRHLDENS